MRRDRATPQTRGNGSCFRRLVLRGYPVRDEGKTGEELLEELNELRAEVLRLASREASSSAIREALVAEKERLLSILEMLPVMVSLQSPDHMVRFANRAFREVIGSGEGKRCYESLWRRCDPCDPCLPFRVFSTKEPQQWEKVGPTGRRFQVHDSLFRDLDGSLLLLEVAVDVTDRKRTEDALRESEARLHAAMESMPFDFWVIGADGRYVMQNSTSRILYGTIVGKYPEEVAPNTEVLGIWLENNRRAFSGELVQGEVSFNLDGEERFFYNIIAPVRDGAEIKGILGANIDISKRKSMEKALQKANDELERGIRERTADLQTKTQHLEEINSALKILLRQRDEDRREFEESALANVKGLLLPYLQKLKDSRLSDEQKAYLRILESNMGEIVSPFVKRLSQAPHGLSPAEMRVADLVRTGRTTKEIADLLRTSVNTVLFHRYNMRRKLGIKGKKTNLRAYLETFV